MINTRCLAMRVKKIFGKLAALRKTKQSPQLGHPNNKGKKIK